MFGAPFPQRRVSIRNNLRDRVWSLAFRTEQFVFQLDKSRFLIVYSIADLGSPFFHGGPELWHHPLAYSTAGELPGTLQHATLVHPALHPQVPVRSYL